MCGPFPFTSVVGCLGDWWPRNMRSLVTLASVMGAVTILGISLVITLK